MSEKVLLKDGIKYKVWTPKREVEEFEPMVIEHIRDIFGEKCKYFAKRDTTPLPEKRSRKVAPS